jgi:hypothetical protein
MQRLPSDLEQRFAFLESLGVIGRPIPLVEEEILVKRIPVFQVALVPVGGMPQTSFVTSV